MTRVALVSLLLVLPAWAQDGVPKTEIVLKETKVAPYTLVRMSIKGLPPKTGYQWFVEPVVRDPKNPVYIDWATGKGPKSKEPEWVSSPGEYRVTLKTLRILEDGTPDWEEITKKVEIAAPGPTPTPIPPNPDVPVPPNPDVPVPPTPTPDNPPLVNAPGLRILILEESSQRDQLTLGQREVLFGGQVRNWLRSNCITEPANPDGAYRIWDKEWNPQIDPDATNWGAIRAKADPKSLPWMVITNGKTSYQGPVESGQKFTETASKYLPK